MTTERATPSQKGQNLLAFYKAGKEIPADDYRDANIQRAQCPNLEVVHHDLTRLNAGHANLTRARLLNCNLHQANFQYCILHNASLAFSHLEGSRFGASKGSDVSFQQTNLRNANFQRSTLWRTNFTLASLELANCTGADLRWSDFRGCNLRQCKFHGAALLGAVFNQQTIDASQWTEQDQQHFAKMGAVWQPSTVNHSVHSEGILIHTTTDAPSNIEWALQAVAANFQCHISVQGRGKTLFLQLKKKGHSYDFAKEIFILCTQPQRSVVHTQLHPHQITMLHQWLNAGAAITLWEVVQSEIVPVERWTNNDAIEVEDERYR